MKKFLMAAAIVCAASFANAAAIAWTLEGIYGAGANGSGWGSDLASGSSYTVELIVGSSLTDGVIGDLITDFDHDLGELDGGYMENYSESASMVADANYYAQVIIKHGESTLSSLVGTICAGSANEDVAEPYITTDPRYVANFEGIELTSKGAFAAEGWVGQAVPEPTSGLLLLLGMAGLALKRKVA